MLKTIRLFKAFALKAFKIDKIRFLEELIVIKLIKQLRIYQSLKSLTIKIPKIRYIYKILEL